MTSLELPFFELGFLLGIALLCSWMTPRSLPFHKIPETQWPLPPHRFCDLHWWSRKSPLVTRSCLPANFTNHHLGVNSWVKTNCTKLHSLRYFIALLLYYNSNLERTQMANNRGWLNKLWHICPVDHSSGLKIMTNNLLTHKVCTVYHSSKANYKTWSLFKTTYA